MQPRIVSLLLLAVFTCLAFAAHAQDAASSALGVPYAGITADGLVMVAPDGTPIGVQNPAFVEITHLRWSPDGKSLAYFLRDPNYAVQPRIALYPSGESFAVSVTNAQSDYPMAWSPDGWLYIALAQTDPAMLTLADVPLPVVRVEPRPGAQAEFFGAIRTTFGCGGGSGLPADWLYDAETGFGGSPQFFAVTATALLYTPACGGSGLVAQDIGTAAERLLAPALQNPTTYHRFVLSPDGTRVAGIESVYSDSGRSSRVVVITIADGSISVYENDPGADQLAWSSDGTALYISAQARSRNVADTLDAAGAERFAQAFAYLLPLDLPGYQVTIYRLTLATGELSAPYTADAYAIGRMVALPSGDLLFSQIGSLDALAAAGAAGTVNAMSADLTQYVSLTVNRLGADGVPVLVADRLAQVSVARGG